MSEPTNFTEYFSYTFEKAGLSDFQDRYKSNHIHTGEEVFVYLHRDIGTENEVGEDFGSIFSDNPYIRTSMNASGVVNILIPIGSVRLAKIMPDVFLNTKGREVAYAEFLGGFGLSGNTSFEQLPGLDSMHRLLENRLKSIIVELEKEDLIIRGILEVFLIETIKRIKGASLDAKTKSEQYHQVIHNAQYTYRTMVRNFGNTDSAIYEILTLKMEPELLHPALTETTAKGVLYHINNKNPWVDGLAHSYLKILFVSWAINKAIDGTPIEASFLLSVSGNPTQERAIRTAIKRMKSIKEDLAVKFLRTYIQYEADNESEEAKIGRILEAVPELEETRENTRTYRNWIDYYLEALHAESRQKK